MGKICKQGNPYGNLKREDTTVRVLSFFLEKGEMGKLSS